MNKLEEILENQRIITEMICRIADGELYFDFKNDQILNMAKLPNPHYTKASKKYYENHRNNPVLSWLLGVYYHVTHPLQSFKVGTYLSKIRKNLI